MSTDRVYHGTPCRKCEMTERYRSNRSCVHCSRNRSIASRNGRLEHARERERAWKAANPDAVKAYLARWKKANPERHRHNVRASTLRRKYGLTLLQYREMLARQDGRCALCCTDQCRSGRRFSVDHCHKTGRVRGLLCFHCNTGIGKLKDDPALLRRAAEYLEESVVDV